MAYIKKNKKSVKKPVKKMSKTVINKRAMLLALEKTLGIVTSACKQVGINRETHYEWIRIDKVYSEAVEDLNNVTLDFAESKLHAKIAGGDTTATIFFLKCKAKKRGYVERDEINIQADKSLNIKVIYE